MHLPPLIQDLTMILTVAAVVTLLFKKIKQPVVLGYVAAGIIVGPHTPGFFSVQDQENIKIWAELGVIFLMFTLGLEFSFRRLAKVGKSAAITGIIELSFMMALGIFVARAFGWRPFESIFFGAAISISSTTIIIKAFEELSLKSRKFAELVFGILIIEDLAAILILVALSNMAMTQQIEVTELLKNGGKLVLIVGGWLVFGIFLVPRIVRSYGRLDNNEMLLNISLALCLLLVWAATSFGYSAALGAFIMGAILAETNEAERIDKLLHTLKDLFGAIFFVSVGMLLNPVTALENWVIIAVAVATVILGKIMTIAFGAVVTGQPLANALRTSMSMGQIGEFSFIIATLGRTTGVVSDRLYPILVTTSLATTLTTPFLIRSSSTVIAFLERRLPQKLQTSLDRYALWLQRNAGGDGGTGFTAPFIRWLASSIVVITVFYLIQKYAMPFSAAYIGSPRWNQVANWFVAMLLSSPFIWSMLMAFRYRQEGNRNLLLSGALLVAGQAVTVVVVGFLSLEFFPWWLTILLMALGALLVAVAFQRHLSEYYNWIEKQFFGGMKPGRRQEANPGLHTWIAGRLGPWDGHLASVHVPHGSFLQGKTLQQARLRERYGINVIAIKRGLGNVVIPAAGEIIFPEDVCLCFGDDDHIETLKSELTMPAAGTPVNATRTAAFDQYDALPVLLEAGSAYIGQHIRGTDIREKYRCNVVAVERDGERIPNPASDFQLVEDDILWLVGLREDLKAVASRVASERVTPPAALVPPRE